MRGADVIVVGAGAAGSVVARRLHDAGASVLLLEAGGPDDDERIHDPRATVEIYGGRDDWGFVTVPQRELHGRRLEWPQGRVLGGSSSINTMIWIRGCREDYDAWAYAGNPGWSYRQLLALFKRVEDFDGGAGEHRGTGGPIPVTTDYERGPIHQAVIDAFGELGVPFNEDHNGEEILGAGWAQYNIRHGRRVSASDAYLGPIRDSPGLEVVLGARARRLLFEGGRCVGVEWDAGDGVEQARAHSEVVLSAGPMGSPKLLLLSGVGPAADLRALGIDVHLDQPAVGANLKDHVHVPLLFTATRPIVHEAATPAMQTNTFLRTRPDLLTPDVQVPSVAALATYGTYPGLELDSDNGFTMAATILRTASRGRLRLASADPADMPLIDPATYEAPGDLTSALAGVRFLRRLAGTAALADWGVREAHPGPIGDDDALLEDYARRVTKTASHPVGTCRMGVGADAVVDPSLRVYGIDGLRVADASIMPDITSGNTHWPSLTIGEKAAELLIGSRAPDVAAPAGVA